MTSSTFYDYVGREGDDMKVDSKPVQIQYEEADEPNYQLTAPESEDLEMKQAAA